MSIDPLEFRRVLGYYATGVTIVTARQGETLAGFTANAFTSVSLDPPLVLVCIGLSNNTLDVIRSSGAFAINILTADQEELARCFAINGPEKYERFCSATHHREQTGSPILNGSLAWIDCRLFAIHPGGDHLILIGEVVALAAQPGTPLLFINGKYTVPPPPT